MPWGKGMDNRSAVLTEEQVRAIRKDPRAQKIIAADYGLSQGQISRIKRRKKWKSIPEGEQNDV